MSHKRPATVIETTPGVGRVQDPRAYDHETAQVAMMHEKFGLGVARTPSAAGTGQVMGEHLACMQEELEEFAVACASHDFPGMADALVDLVVFAKGTAVQLGLPWARLFDDVMRANLAKVRGVGHRGHAVDLVKPPGWQGPRTEEILKAYGWRRDQMVNGCEPDDPMPSTYRDDIEGPHGDQ